jgi:porphobilinogen synthase
MQLLRRPRRNRASPAIRALIRETQLTPHDLVQPYFLLPGTEQCQPIASLPGINRLSTDLVIEEARTLHEQGVQSILLFPVLPDALKDDQGSEALNPDGLLPLAIRKIKDALPSLHIMADVALDPYSSHGHDGLIDAQDNILNDDTVDLLCEMSLNLANAGIDVIAPSDMMDGRVAAIRSTLDSAGYTQTAILSYSAKYASAFYGPFRDALGSAPRFGDKKTYQMDPANAREALLECLLDEEEGADILMVKPALAYLDIIASLRAQTLLPIAAYQVSGEYAMLQSLNSDRALLESLIAIKRAGADMIFSYGCAQVLKLLAKN